MDQNSLPGGGPAFPTENGRQVGLQTYHYEGMALRDYFAAKAMNGVMAMIAAGRHDLSITDGACQQDRLAKEAFRIADAMLKARQTQ